MPSTKDNERYLELVESIFNKDILCLLRREYLAMLIEVPKQIEFTKSIYVNSGGAGNGVVRTEVCENEDWIVESLYGIRRVTADEEMRPEMNLIGPEEHYLSISDIAELVGKRATVHIKRPIETVRMEGIINNYLAIVKEYSFWDLHFKAPPAEDMNMLVKLRDMLEPIVAPYLQNKLGDSPLAQLLRETQVTITEATNIPVVSLNGATSSIEFTNPFDKNKNPFSIKNFP